MTLDLTRVLRELDESPRLTCVMTFYHVHFTCAPDYLARRLPLRPAHLKQLAGLREDGRVVAGGPEPDGTAAHIFYRVMGRAQLDRLLDENEFNRAGLFADSRPRVVAEFLEPLDRPPAPPHVKRSRHFSARDGRRSADFSKTAWDSRRSGRAGSTRPSTGSSRAAAGRGRSPRASGARRCKGAEKRPALVERRRCVDDNEADAVALYGPTEISRMTPSPTRDSS